MSQQALDLRRSIQIVRRRRKLVVILMTVGLLGGAAFAVLNPAMVMSTALIVLPQQAESSQSAAVTGSNVASDFIATQEVVAGSSPVLAGALPSIHPAISLTNLRKVVKVQSPTTSILAVSASAATAAQAETRANAIASSYISYVGSGDSPVGSIPARILQPATTATGSGPVKHLVIVGLIGVVLGALLGIILALAITRRDPRLRERDEIAAAIGVPVIASIPAEHPTDAAGWARLMEEYEPGTVYRWRLQNVLRQLGYYDLGLGNGGYRQMSSLMIVSLASDPGALALGPQLAVVAASLGIATTLVVGPQQDPDVTAALRTACQALLPASSKLSGLLQVAVSDHGSLDTYSDAALVIVVTVIDSRSPRLPDSIRRTATTLLGVSAGVVTAEQLARAAVCVTTDGRQIAGILVADPDRADHTTGRVPQLSPPPTRHRRPTRLVPFTTEIRR